VRQPTPSRVFTPSHGAHGLSPAERAVYDTLDPARIPQHVAIIMDGNGRWAGKRALKRFLGHQQGAESVRFVVEAAARIDLQWLTLYAFSLENNLRRPKSEVSFLMKLLKSYLVSNIDSMQKNNIRMEYIGRTHELPTEVQDTMAWAQEQTARNTGTTLTLALNYGSRDEIARAARAAAAKGEITPESISAELDTADLPPLDLLIRTSGEVRLSNFLMWQAAYAEMLFTDVLWPDFGRAQLEEAIAEFVRRERRFGGR